MISSIVENKMIKRLYDDANWALTKFYSTEDDISSFLNIANNIESLLLKTDIKYRHFSIYGSPAQHSINVGILNGKIGKYLGMSNLLDLILGGILHDIGKFYISHEIREKPNKLTAVERIEMSKHTELGYKVVKNLIDNDNVLNIISNHHKVINSLNREVDLEYKCDDISFLYPLICGISDITDAMLSFRIYKNPLSIQDVKEDLSLKGVTNIDSLFKYIL